MTAPAVVMREIHRLRRFAHELQEQLDRFPRLLKAQQAKAARLEEQYREAQDKIKHLKVTIHEKEVSLKTTHTQLKKYEKQLDEAADKKQMDALRAQIASTKAASAQLEEDILNAMGETEERTAKLPEEAAAVERGKRDFAEWERTSKERQAQQTAQLQETTARLKEVEAEVPEQQQAQYRRLVNAMGPDALAAVEERICTSCRTEITSQTYNELLMNRYVACRACGRILYLPETPAAEES
jgi:predicted  nucleic acid-binding Zn-ribbon protein